MSGTAETPDVSGLSQPGAQAPAGTSAPTPTQAAGGMVDPSTPHGRLLQMVQSLAVGVDSFARAAATHGREGGVGEVQDYFAKQQAEKLQQEQATAQQAESKQRLQEGDLRMRAMNANMLSQQAAYHHALQMYPLEEKEQALKVLNDATASYKDALQEGYDIADPRQAALWRQMQANIINIPFSGNQPTQDVLSTVHDAATKDGKSLTDYVPLTTYTDAKHGTGGEVSLVPVAGLQQVEATPRQISTGMAQMRATLDTATTALGKDDPDVKALSGKVDLIQGVLDKGGKPSAYDFISLNSSVLGPLSTRIAGATQKEKIAKEQADTAKAQADAIRAGREANPQTAAADAALKTAAEKKAALPFVGPEAAARAAAEQPYQVALKQMEAPIAAGVAGNKDARDKVESNYLKPFLEKEATINELRSSVADAKAGNVAGARAALIKLAGITVPAGTKGRGLAEAVSEMKGMGSDFQKWVGSIKGALTGDKWTDAMSQDVLDFAADQEQRGRQNVRQGINMTNALYDTKIDADKVLEAHGATGPGNSDAAPLSDAAQKLLQKHSGQ